MYRKIIVRLILCIGILNSHIIQVVAQSPSYNFTHISSEEGLVGDWVQSAVLDREGFMWFATLEGLSRYEGNHFQSFNFIEGDSTSIGGNTVMGITEDSKGKIWVITMGDAGLNLYNRDNETFERFPYPIEGKNQEQLSYCLLQDKYDDHILWIGTLSHGLLRFDKNLKSFSNFNLKPEFQGQENNLENSIIHLTNDLEDKNRIWLASYTGLYYFLKNTGHVNYIPYPDGMEEQFRQQITWVLPQSSNTLWLGTEGSGLGKFEIDTETWSFYRPEDQGKKGVIYSNKINSISPASENDLWLCSDTDGLMLFNKNTNRFSFIQPDILNPKSYISNEVSGLYTDRFQRHWFFNKLNGVSILDPQGQKFKFTYFPDELICQDDQLKQAFDFSYDKINNKTYIIAGRCYRLYIFDEDKGFTDLIPLDKKIGKGREIFLLNDSKNNLWLGGNGLFLFNKKTKQIESKFENTLLGTSRITSFTEAKDGHLWIGTQNNGLFKLNSNNGAIKNYVQNEAFPIAPKSSRPIFDIVEDDNGVFWIAAHLQGLYKFNPATEKFSNIPLDDFEIMTLEKDKHGIIWVGSISSGILLFDPTLPTIDQSKKFTIEDGLVSNQISHIVKDSYGTIWISTRYGISWYDEAENKFYNYDKQDGIREPYQNKFDLQKGFKATANGKILIGDKHGFYITDPTKMKETGTPPNVVITDFKVFDEPRRFEENLNSIQQINLKHNENFFSFDFSALEFFNPEKNQFAYILEGFNKDWIYLNNNTTANFTNVGAGNYTLKVKAANSHGIWNEEGLQLKIKILPPWWKTIWAYLLYAILGIAAIVGLYRFQFNRKMASMETLRLKELNDLKTRLYTNITHEFRTPLTIILGMAKEVGNKVDDGAKRGLKMIERNGNQLLNLVDQMLDLSKLESGRLRLNPIQSDIVHFIQYLTESFKTFSGTKNILLTSYSEEDELMMDFDPERIQHIISNLLSNAIKFTDEKGKIILHISTIQKSSNENESERILQLKIKDDGIGISEKDLPHIFDRFYQVDASQTRRKGGTGVGLSLTKELVDLMGGTIAVKSKSGHGTEFTLLFPITRNAQMVSRDEQQVAFSQIKTLELNNTTAENFKEIVKSKTNLPQLLVIEDNSDVFDYIKICLLGRYEIFEAEDGQQGIDKAIEIIPDIIISDVMMPEKDGFEVTQFLKNDNRTSHIPIILLTGKVDDDSRIEGFEKGADAYLPKPFNKQELIVRLEKLIELRQLLQLRYSNITVEKSTPLSAPEKFKVEDEFVIKMKAIVEKRLDDPDFSIPQFCKDAGMSRTQLHRKLKALTNRSATVFIRSIRLQKAKELLETSDMNISEIAYEVGFRDPSYFSRSFFEEFQISPSDTRKHL